MNTEKKVLIVDDEVGVRHSIIRGIQRKFNKTNNLVSIAEASNGQQAIELANISPPDLILMDVRMPIMNGLKACRLLRRDSKFAGTKIIILTGGIIEESEGWLSGADEYLIKSFDIKTLLALIERGLFPPSSINKTAPAYLNGLLSKECFFDIFLIYEVARAKRFHHPLSLLLLKFSPKNIKEKDKQNQAFILTLLNRRASDKVIDWGVNTFAILLTETTADDAYLVAKHIVSRIDSSPKFLRTCVGIANLEDTLTDNLVVNAESSLKESVRTGDIILNRKAIH
jgi:CheY-like chemotaxis protein